MDPAATPSHQSPGQQQAQQTSAMTIHDQGKFLPSGTEFNQHHGSKDGDDLRMVEDV